MKKQAKPSQPKPDPNPVLMTELVLPSHTNALGTIFGGVVMAWIDIAGAIAAQRYSRSPVVTVSIDYLHFIVPIKTGYTVQIHAQVTHVGRTSMEVEVLVDAENTVTGDVRRATRAYLTYVAVDEKGRPKPAPSLKATSEMAKKKLLEAEKRRAERLKWYRKHD
jgi:acyl-CoA hydrolase